MEVATSVVEVLHLGLILAMLLSVTVFPLGCMAVTKFLEKS